jgi:hypothetical protein
MRYSTMLKGLFFIGLLGAGGWLVWTAYCSSCCKSAFQEADLLQSKGNARKALFEIDVADARCDCIRFADGDEPYEITRTRDLYHRVARKHGAAVAFEMAENAEGYLLQSMAEE